MDQRFGSSLEYHLWVWVPYVVSIRTQIAELQLCEGLTWTERPDSKVTHSHGWEESAGSWKKTLVSFLMGFSTGLLVCPQYISASFSHNEWSKSTRKKMQWLLWSSLEVTALYPQYPLGHRFALVNIGGDCIKVWILGKQDHWGPSLKLT